MLINVLSNVILAHCKGLAWLAAAKQYKWSRVATLSSQENLHALLTEKFLRGAQADGELTLFATKTIGIQVVISESFPGSQNHDISLQLNNIALKGVTVIFMACYSDDAKNIVRTPSRAILTNLRSKRYKIYPGCLTKE